MSCHVKAMKPSNYRAEQALRLQESEVPEFLNIWHMRVVRVFLFAFITFNPCFTAWVCHGVFTMCFRLLDYIAYVLS
jgi:hypothetical protein